MVSKSFFDGSLGHAGVALGGDTASARATDRSAKGWGIAAAVVIHAAAAVLVFRMTAPPPVDPAKPIMVSLVEAPKPPEPVIEPPKPRPVVKRPVPQKRPVRVPDLEPVVQPTPVEPLIASAATSPSAVREVPAAPPAPPAPAPDTPTPKPAPVVEPRFDAAYLNNPAPAYPAVSRRLGEQGRVLLRVHVDQQGSPITVTLRTSSGHERLDNIALETVRRWKFVPARRGEEAVSAWVIVPIVFNLRS